MITDIIRREGIILRAGAIMRVQAVIVCEKDQIGRTGIENTITITNTVIDTEEAG